jgi:hypothetical protein
VGRRPAVLLGFDVSPEGAVLVEAFAGLDAPVAVPANLAAETERSIDRWRGKAPVGLGELTARPGVDVADAVIDALVSRAGGARSVDLGDVIGGAPSAAGVGSALDPIPAGFEIGPTIEVPIGWLDTAVDRASGRVWLGGDVLAPRHLLAAIAEGMPVDRAQSAVEGAKVEDLVAAVEAARS